MKGQTACSGCNMLQETAATRAAARRAKAAQAKARAKARAEARAARQAARRASEWQEARGYSDTHLCHRNSQNPACRNPRRRSADLAAGNGPSQKRLVSIVRVAARLARRPSGRRTCAANECGPT